MKRVFVTLALCLSACGPAPIAERAQISPDEFALVPCGDGKVEAPCALAIIGGKRLLFGAPAGVGATLEGEDLRLLDGVFLFSLRGAQIEGLDEVRNATWRAGRAKPLPVTGPDGVEQVIGAINLAFEASDALRIVDEGVPKGGFDAAILVRMASVKAAQGVIFDTGDVIVSAQVRPDQALRYLVSYQGADPIVIEPCRGEDCSFGTGQTWPLEQVEYIVKTQP